MKKYVEKNFRWSYQEFGLALLGELLFAFAINLFIVPNALYNGGVLSIAQLIRTAILDLTGLNMKIDSVMHHVKLKFVYVHYEN